MRFYVVMWQVCLIIMNSSILQKDIELQHGLIREQLRKERPRPIITYHLTITAALWSTNNDRATEFYHSWNTNIVLNSPNSWEALTSWWRHNFFKTMLVSVCITGHYRIDRQMQNIFYSGYNVTISIVQNLSK